jgi:hypothetical protein
VKKKHKKQVMVVEELAVEEGAGVGWRWRIWQRRKESSSGVAVEDVAAEEGVEQWGGGGGIVGN